MAEKTDKQKTEKTELKDSAPADDAAVDAPAVEPTEPEAPAEATEEPADEPKLRVIKFMGTSDVRRFKRGDTAGGTLKALPCDVSFDKSNNWKVTTSQFPLVPDYWWNHIILNVENFQDVTGLDVVPLNGHQRTFLGMVQNGEATRVAAPEPGALPVSSK